MSIEGHRENSSRRSHGRPYGKIGAAVLSIGLLGLCSCADQTVDTPMEKSRGESGYFVDENYLDSFCVSSGIHYPVITEERTIDGVDSAPSDATAVKLHRAMFAETLGIYPRILFDEIRLRKIILCRRLSVEGISCQAFSDVEHGTMFVSIDAGLPDASLKRTIHHEIFHFVDFSEDNRLDEDRAWSALNPVAFLYGSGGGSMQKDPGAVKPDDSLVGFVNRYSTSGLAEDKAEVYAFLIFDGPWMIRRASADSILGQKVERIRTSLRRFGPLTSGLLSRLQ